jgi:hypothetical protein
LVAVVVDPPPAAVVEVVVARVAVVDVVVVGVPLTLPRVPTDTRTVTATTKMMITAAARTTESEPDDGGPVPDDDGPVPDDSVCDCSSTIPGPACPAPPPGASLSAGRVGAGVAGL